ncbi:hypothetical protein KAFR_0B05890 [Kazachstania africana CBS 2517]|uniref:Uncharacterized protein n=1 Tax=Kazachstania africana (strain ATCC 22294 / BCRC 22015 / CBS 2517 / CECT 1963 / NBRC 1671 / NRRL Y-8276) TaxID=1071382 RepID=H2AR85_KAZAF|nr:hypothetical protein KAFR_0B05890 [Kazachstania africana CBS 2517]CCF56885.1 hypothetical protein KAFR_0B05890 [Kazachstania africana CBS 2517]
MSIIHPVQSVVSSENEQVIYTVVKNMLLAYKKSEAKDSSYQLVGKWIDDTAIGGDNQEGTNNEGIKKAKSNEGTAVSKNGQGSNMSTPSTHAYIRNLTLSKNEDRLFACTDSDKAIIILDIDFENMENCLNLVKRQRFPKRPNAIAISNDEKTIMIADKFGDVYSMDVDAPVVEKINDEVEPILGHVSMLTDILFKESKNGKRFIITADRDEHIKISHFPQSFIVDKWLFGHKEFVSSINAPQWKCNLLLSAGGDDSVFFWDWESGKLLSEFNYAELVKPYLTEQHAAPSRFQNEANDVVEYAVSKVVSLENLPYVAFFIEATNVLFILSADLENNTLTLKAKIDLPGNVVSLSACKDAFILSLDNRDLGNSNFVKFIKFNNETNDFSIDEPLSSQLDSVLVDSLKTNDSATVESNEIYPLYNVTSLKKHGEHYS